LVEPSRDQSAAHYFAEFRVADHPGKQQNPSKSPRRAKVIDPVRCPTLLWLE
jgi:hypothetical protein